MPNKKIEVVELNKVEEEIILEEKQSPLVLFFKKHRRTLLLILIILSLLMLITGIFMAVKNLGESTDPTITQINTNLENLETSEINFTGNYSLTTETAERIFRNTGAFKANGLVIITKTVTAGSYEIKYYSDGTALKIMSNGHITRINPLEDGRYGIDDYGVINTKATVLDVTLKETKTYPWGTVNYYSDGSASVVNDKIETFVRNGNDIYENYLTRFSRNYLTRFAHWWEGGKYRLWS